MSLQTKRQIPVTVTFSGNGTIQKIGAMAFSGGVPKPRINKSNLSFSMHREYQGKNGLWNPRGDSIKAGFQINVFGTSKGYRKLAEYFLSLAELDSRKDEDYHEHLDGVFSADNKTRLNLIFRKNDKRIKNKS